VPIHKDSKMAEADLRHLSKNAPCSSPVSSLITFDILITAEMSKILSGSSPPSDPEESSGYYGTTPARTSAIFCAAAGSNMPIAWSTPQQRDRQKRINA
jgi:hypothetical protein